jgi:serine/threonine protein kinase
MATVHDILHALKRYRLVEPGQLDELTRELRGRTLEPRELGRLLIERDWLTPFQVNQLFKGKGGDLLLGSYVLLERLGEGGMGTVYKARNWKLGQIVAVKLIRPERLKSANGVRRFQREIRAAADLDHPNIVRALDADEVRGAHLLVMEYVAGGIDLHRLVKQRGPLAIDEACHCVRQAALGLEHAFERGLVHRDIKPHNLLVSGGGLSCAGAASSLARGGAGEARQQHRTPHPSTVTDHPSPTTTDQPPLTAHQVKILDFGLALRDEDSGDSSSTLTQEGSVMGTLDYIAPEQATDSHRVDVRADLYSLGCTFFYLLAGRPPFPGGEALAKLMKHRFDPPPPITTLRADAPPAVEAIIDKLLAKQPEDRFQTPAELLVALGHVEQGYAAAADIDPAAVDAPAADAAVTAPAAAEITDSASAGETVADQWADIVSDSSAKHPAAPPSGSMPAGLAPWRYAAMGVAVVILAVCVWRPWQTPQSEGKGPAGPAVPMIQDKVFLTQMQEYDVQTDPGYKFSKGGQASNGDDLLVDGRHTPNGIYLVPPPRGQAQARYRLARQFTTFKTGVALCDGADAPSGVIFTIVGDNRILWKSEPILKSGSVQECEVSVKGVVRLDLVVECSGDATTVGAVWVEPALQTIQHAFDRPLVIQGRADDGAPK